jgi:hypothetical protein
MKIMAKHGSASTREETPHQNTLTQTRTVSDQLKRRAQSILNNKLIDGETRAIVRYSLETNDVWLAHFVERIESGESLNDNVFVPLTSEQKMEVLAEMICRSGDEPAAALLVLMTIFEKDPHPRRLANAAKHFAFTRSVELNVYEMAEVQIGLLEGRLLPRDSSAV